MRLFPFNDFVVRCTVKYHLQICQVPCYRHENHAYRPKTKLSFSVDKKLTLSKQIYNCAKLTFSKQINIYTKLTLLKQIDTCIYAKLAFSKQIYIYTKLTLKSKSMFILS